jgi:hypothetical protein
MPLPKSKLPFAFSQPAFKPADRVADMGSRLSRTLGIARALAESGRQLDLRGFEDGVGQLCAQTLDLPSAEGRGMIFMLHEILGQINTLTEILSRGTRAEARGRQSC